MDGEAVAFLMIVGRGWQVLQNEHPQIVNLALHAIRLTACVDQCHRHGPGHLTLRDLGILGTIFQHELYELNPTPGAGDSSKDPVFNVARLALQLYGDVALFPTAEMYHARDRLCGDLLGALRGYPDMSDPRFGHAKVFVLWAVALGGTISDLTYQRDWYVRQLTVIINQLDLEWDTFKDCMKLFLWWDFIFEERARDLWDEAFSQTGRKRATDGPQRPIDSTGARIKGSKKKWLPIQSHGEPRLKHES